jgi:hypothetical protein
VKYRLPRFNIPDLTLRRAFESLFDSLENLWDFVLNNVNAQEDKVMFNTSVSGGSVLRFVDYNLNAWIPSNYTDVYDFAVNSETPLAIGRINGVWVLALHGTTQYTGAGTGYPLTYMGNILWSDNDGATWNAANLFQGSALIPPPIPMLATSSWYAGGTSGLGFGGVDRLRKQNGKLVLGLGGGYGWAISENGKDWKLISNNVAPSLVYVA